MGSVGQNDYRGGNAILKRNKSKHVVAKPSMSHVGEFITQIYVINPDGIVLFSREYDRDNLMVDPQLIGGFLAAINGFARSTALDKCPCDGNHRVAGIETSCAKWFISSQGDFTVSLLVMNESPLMRNKLWPIIDSVGLRIINTFEIISMYAAADNTIEIFREQYEEFGKAVDSIVYETISEIEKIGFTNGRYIEINNTFRQ